MNAEYEKCLPQIGQKISAPHIVFGEFIPSNEGGHFFSPFI